MKKLAPPAVLLLACIIAVPGCPSSQSTKPSTTEPKAVAKMDPRRVGLELVRQAPDAARYWEGLQLLNADIQQSPAMRERLTLKPETRKFLQTDAGLSDDELQEVESPTYRRDDAHYLAECFLLRDALRALDVNGMPPEELASQALAWIERQVLLHEQGDDWLPPAQVLESGYGSIADRARVFLAMLRQIPMHGCAIVLPDAPDQPVLIGAFAPAAPDKVFLFDPRYASSVRTPDGKVATVQDVQKDPKLVAHAGLDAKQLASVQLKLACPLNALPTRMEDLEHTLLSLDRVILHVDAAAVQQQLGQATHLPVHIWNAPVAGKQMVNSPTRVRRLFLPPDEGGVDKTDRRSRFLADLAPWAAVFRAFDQLNLGPDQLPNPARARLVGIVDDLVKKYDVQPHEMLLHGKGQDAILRLARAQHLFDDENLDNLADDPKFPRAVAEWRNKAQTGYGRLASGDPGGQAAVNGFWGEDQFLLTILHTEGEDRLSSPALGQERPPSPTKTTTTSIVAFAVRDHLKQRALWLRAMVWREKAHREQTRAERELDKSKRQRSQKLLSDTWNNMRVAWNQVKDRPTVGPAGRQQRLTVIRDLLARNNLRSTITAAQLLAGLHLELHQHYAANLHFAEAVYHLDGPAAAQSILRTVDADLAALLEKDKSGQVGLQSDVDDAVARLKGASATPLLVHSIALLAGDWTPRGNYYWIRQRIARRLAQWEKS